MNNENELLEINSNDNLATRWQRLWASLLDSLVMMIVTLPLMYFGGFFEKVAQGVPPSLMESLLISLAGVAFFILINYKFLVSNGQTVGKKVLNIKIVDMNESLPSGKDLSIRYLAYFGLGQIPKAGGILSLINILFIFGAEKRCGHDYIAGTKVIKAND